MYSAIPILTLLLSLAPLRLEATCRAIANFPNFPDLFPNPDIFVAPTGMITSPNYPNNFNADEQCAFEIIGEPGSVIDITFNDFETGNDPNNPILSLIAGSQVTNLANGNTLPASRTFNTNRVVISWVVGPLNPTEKGWKLTYRIRPASSTTEVTRTMVLSSEQSTLLLAVISAIGAALIFIFENFFYF